MFNSLVESIKGYYNKLKDTIHKNGGKMGKDIVNFVVGYIIFIFTLYVIGWAYLWYVKGVPDLPALLEAVKQLTTPAVLAVIKFITVVASDTFIDLNHNGIDDREEEAEAVINDIRSGK